MNEEELQEEALQEGTAVSTTETGTTVNVTYPESEGTYNIITIEPLYEGDADLTATMAYVIRNVLGDYQRQIYTVTEYDSSGVVIGTSQQYVEGLAGLDYHWITGAILFGLMIAGCFKLLGGLIRS